MESSSENILKQNLRTSALWRLTAFLGALFTVILVVILSYYVTPNGANTKSATELQKELDLLKSSSESHVKTTSTFISEKKTEIKRIRKDKRRAKAAEDLQKEIETLEARIRAKTLALDDKKTELLEIKAKF